MNKFGVDEFDVASYATRYKGRNLVLRLKHIAEVSVGDLELKALRQAFSYMEKCDWDIFCDTKLYKEIADLINGRLEERLFDLMSVWNTYYLQKLHILGGLWHDCEDGDKKESLALLLDSLCYAFGEYRDPFSGNKRGPFSARPYRSIDASLKMMLLGIETRQFDLVRYPRLFQTGLQTAFFSELHRFKRDCANSLADLLEARYFDAAQGFLKLIRQSTQTEFGGELVYDYSELLSSEDIITYGVICGVATFGRSKSLLEYVMRTILIEPLFGGIATPIQNVIKPNWIAHRLMKLLTELLEGHFNNCLQLLECLKPFLRLDIYLFPQVDELSNAIRDVILANYVQGFSKIWLNSYTVGKVRESDRMILDTGGLIVSETDVTRLLENNQIQGHIEVNEAGLLFHSEIIEEIVPPLSSIRQIEFAPAQHPDE